MKDFIYKPMKLSQKKNELAMSIADYLIQNIILQVTCEVNEEYEKCLDIKNSRDKKLSLESELMHKLDKSYTKEYYYRELQDNVDYVLKKMRERVK